MKSLALNGLTGLLLAVYVFSVACAYAESDDVDSNTGLAPLFADHSPLKVTIAGPLKTLMWERPDEEYLEGTFTYTKDDGTEQTFDLKMRTRGNFRRQKKLCNFAPIRLNFRKGQVADTVFAGQDKLKLVTHCQQNKATYEQFVLREYIAYRILQVLTNRSFGVRLFHIDYVDTETGKTKLKYGFVLEDDDHVAERVGMKSIRTGNVQHDDLERRQENLVNVFQYLIGNTDFSLVHGPANDDCCHNSKLLSATGGPPYTPLPYDFDFSGLVDAPYANPNPRFRIKTVRSRRYRGLCSNNDLLPETFDRFIANRDAVYAIVDELDMLSKISRRSVASYLDSFYDDISQAKAIDREFINDCVGQETREISNKSKRPADIGKAPQISGMTVSRARRPEP